MREGRKVILWDHPDYEPEKGTLEFRLTYDGELRSSSNNSPNATEKHAIRRIFHRQLKQLWEITPHLHDSQNMLPGSIPILNKPDPPARLDYLANNFSMFGFKFVPLVAKDLDLWCGIDILFLRSGPPGKVFERGDVDNRFKTIFDALKMPRGLEELGDFKDKKPPTDEEPFFCLLEDDGLVAKVAIETDTLLEPIGGGIPSKFDARLVITVKLRPAKVTIANLGFA